MTIAYCEINSPVGKLKLYSDGDSIIKLELPNYNTDETGIWLKRYFGEVRIGEKDALCLEAERQISSYFKKELNEFHLPVKLFGTVFQKKIWNALLGISYGDSVTYKQIANICSCGGGYRAVGNAIGKNPVLIIIPCHRVVGSNHKLVGFAGKLKLLDVKKYLLETENIVL